MKRGTKCIAQTINLSNPETCVRPKRVQKLVSADVVQPCPSSGAGSTSYWTPRPVAVKVCTRKDMQKSCPPKLCDCPQKALAKSAPHKLCRALLFLIKGGIAASLVYWTHLEGLWGNGAETEDLYYRILATISPDLSERPGSNDESLPHFERIKNSLVDGYNRALFTVFSTIIDTSIGLHRQLQNILYPCEKTEKEPSSSS